MPRSVVVYGVEIPERLILEEAQNHPGASAAEAHDAAARALAVKALLLNRARELGLEPQPESVGAGLEETREEALIRAVLDAEVEVRSPNEEECLRVYEARRERFRTPALYEASHILFEPAGDDEGAWRAAFEEAAAALTAFRDGGAGFEDLARTLSDCPSGALGGSLGQLSPGDLAREVEAVLGGLEPGDVASEPVRSRFGWHLLRLDRRAPAAVLPFDAVRDQIRTHLESRSWTAAAMRYVETLAEAARAHGVAVTVEPGGAVAEPRASLGGLLGEEGLSRRFTPWLEAVDPELHDRLVKTAEAQGLGVPDFVQSTVGRFLSDASDEAWTKLISAARDAEDPALACVQALLKSSLQPRRRAITLINRI